MCWHCGSFLASVSFAVKTDDRKSNTLLANPLIANAPSKREIKIKMIVCSIVTRSVWSEYFLHWFLYALSPLSVHHVEALWVSVPRWNSAKSLGYSRLCLRDTSGATSRCPDVTFSFEACLLTENATPGNRQVGRRPKGITRVCRLMN